MAAQCLETAFELPAPGSDASAAPSGQLDETHPLGQLDLFELFLGASPAAGTALSEERRAEADAVKNEGNGLMKEDKFHEALNAYSRFVFAIQSSVT